MCPALRRRSFFTGIPSHCGRCRSEGPPAAGRTVSALGLPFRLSRLSLAFSRLSPFCQIGEGLLTLGAGCQMIIAALDLPERLRVVRRWRLPLPDQNLDLQSPQYPPVLQTTARLNAGRERWHRSPQSHGRSASDRVSEEAEYLRC